MSEHRTQGIGRAPESMPDLTENERVWIEFLRLISDGSDPALRLRDVQLLRRIMRRRRLNIE